MVVGDDDETGLGEEPQRGFAADHSLDAYTNLQRLALLSYGYRCALTGAQFGAKIATMAKPEVLRLALALIVLAVALRMAFGLGIRPDEVYTVVPL